MLSLTGVVLPCRNAELSKDLGQQYDVAAELRRSLEAEAALHKSNVSHPVGTLKEACLARYKLC